ncbi:unnamed protein product [marine sediment metagenome]|uniref:Uncharacterized protein n=1 Tax=marine sediment metagenome TaxID=412755 RepID=X0YU61_9ZZZZ
MVVKILVCWDDSEEVERASAIRRMIDDALDAEDLHSGLRTVNIPPKTFGIIVPDNGKLEMKDYFLEEKVND